MKNIIGDVAKAFITVLLFSIAGYLLLTLAYCIPVDGRMSDNVAKSALMIEEEGDYPTLMDNYNSRLDNWTDTIMILEASNNSEAIPFIASLSSKWRTGNGIYPVESMLAQYVDGYEAPMGFRNESYARYWHGYLIVLKPLLWLFNYGTVRSFICFVEVLLIGLIIMELCRKKMNWLVIPFILLFFFLNPVSVMLSLQYCWVTIIMLLGVYILLKYRIEGKYLKFYFVLLGCLTSYFDLLTFPLITLTIPLIFYLLTSTESNLKDVVLKVIELSFFWAFGYGVNWVMKWILSSLITGDNVIMDGISAVANRSGNENMGEHINYVMTLIRNLGCSLQIPWLIPVVGYIVLYIKKFAKHKNNIINILVPLLIVGLYPFMWSFVVSNHTFTHCMFTFRIFGTCVFAFTAYISLYLNTIKSIEEN